MKEGININSPILNPSPVCKRTYLLHEVYKAAPFNENIMKYLIEHHHKDGEPLEKRKDGKKGDGKREENEDQKKIKKNVVIKNLIDNDGRTPSWYGSLEYLELHVLSQC